MQHVNLKASTAAHVADGSFISLCLSIFLPFFFFLNSNLIFLTQFPDGYTLKASICYGNALYKVLPSAWHVNSFMTI